MSIPVKERQYGPQYKLIGKNYVTADLAAKITGKSKYAEDFRAEGMLFCKLLLSPVPHGRVQRIDASEALAMPGVRAILTAADLPAPADTLTDNGTVIKASKWGERGLTMEPVYQGEPILAVAAVDELTAAEAVERIQIDFERLPFAVDPLDTLRPGGRTCEQTVTSGRLHQAASPQSRNSSGPMRTSPKPSTAVCRWAERLTNGRMATSTLVSKMPRLFLTKHSSRQTSAIKPLRPGVQWLTGRTASSTFTPEPRALPKLLLPSHDG